MTLDRKLRWFIILLVAANLFIVLLVVLGAFQPAPRPAPPNPNGYDDLVAAGRLVVDPGDFSTLPPADLAVVVSSNTAALKRLRVGFTRQSLPPGDYSRDGVSRLFDTIGRALILESVLDAEGQIALFEQRTNDALESYLDCLRLGQQCGQGATIIVHDDSAYIESIGRKSIKAIESGLGASGCRRIASALESVDAAEPKWRELMDAQNRSDKFAYKPTQRFMNSFPASKYRTFEQSLESRYRENQQDRRRMAIHFAARAYELEKGKPPASAAELVPEYLKAVPKDPVTGARLVPQ